MIHRAPFGSLERFIALLIEHCGGQFPLWLSPEQYAILPISEKYNAYAYEVAAALETEDLRGFIDDRNEKIGKKIRDQEVRKVPFMLVVGEKEHAQQQVSVREHGRGDIGTMSITEFSAHIKKLIAQDLN
jgi:threonyl-tRNA synthetase